MLVPTNEQGVIVLFSQVAHLAGIEIVSAQTRFPDLVILYKGSELKAEVEYRSSSFIGHGHDILGCDVIVCWIDDLDDPILPVIELSDPDWHKKDWYKVTRKDREIKRLLGEIKRLKRLLTSYVDNALSTESKQRKVRERQSAIVAILSASDEPLRTIDIQQSLMDDYGFTVGIGENTIRDDCQKLEKESKVIREGGRWHVIK